MKDDIRLKKSVITFERKPSKQGDDYFFKIPRNYIRNNLINPEKIYNIYLEEKED